MKKILSFITEEEKDRGISLNALLATYNTLLTIERYEVDKYSVLKSVSKCEEDLQNYWNDITEKYNIPLYIDRTMKIDSENNYIYITI